MGRGLWARVSLLMLLALVLLIAAPVSHWSASAAVGGARAVLLMPYDAGGRSGDESPATHGQSYLKSWAGFAWDLHASSPYTNVPVKARFVSSDGPVSLKVLKKEAVGAAGRAVQIQVSVSGQPVGWVRFQHLNNVPDSVCETCAAPTPDTVIGYTAPNTRYLISGTTYSYGYPPSAAWVVRGGYAGVQVHVEVRNGCYHDTTLNAPRSANDPMLMLSSNSGSYSNQVCDSAEMAQVASPVSGLANHLVEWDGDTAMPKTSWYVTPDLKRLWVPDTATFACLATANGLTGADVLSSTLLNQLPDQIHRWAPCGDTMTVSRTLRRGMFLKSGDGRYKLILQGDGNLVLYGPSGALWSNHQFDTDYAIFQSDGNFVTYRANNSPSWATGTGGKGGTRIVVQSDGNLVMFSPSGVVWSSRPSGSVVGNYAIGNSEFLLSDGTNMWSCGSDNVLTKMRASTGAVLARYQIAKPPASNCDALAFDGTNIWVANYGNNTVTKLRASSGVRVAIYSAGKHPQGMAFDGTNIWVAHDAPVNTVSKLRASDGAILATYGVDENPWGLVSDGANMWVANNDGYTIMKLRQSGGGIVGTYRTSSPVGITFDGTYLWVANSYTNAVTKFRPGTGTVAGIYRVGDEPSGVAFDGHNIWVGSTNDGVVTKLLASTGALLGKYHLSAVGGGPGSVVYDGNGGIWVATQTGVAKLAT